MKTEARDALLSLAKQQFLSRQQAIVLAALMKGEEKQYFFDKVCEYADRIRSMPKTYEQDGKGDDAIVYLHYFLGGADWWITEKDMEGEQLQAFGYARYAHMPECAELGYISIVELAKNNAELDLYWTPKTLREVKRSHA